MKELQRQGNPNIVIALAGNKVDLASKRTVEIEVWQASFEFDCPLFTVNIRNHKHTQKRMEYCLWKPLLRRLLM